MQAVWAPAYKSWISIGRGRVLVQLRGLNPRTAFSSTYFIQHPISTNTSRPSHRDDPFPEISQLSELIKQGNIEAADDARLDLVAQGVKLPNDDIFVKAAEVLLRQPDYLERIPSLISWFELFPKAQSAEQKPFSVVRQLLFANTTNNIDLIVAFGRVCIAKGYIQLVEEEVIPTILISAPDSQKGKLVHNLRREIDEFKVHQDACRNLSILEKSGATLPGASNFL